MTSEQRTSERGPESIKKVVQTCGTTNGGSRRVVRDVSDIFAPGQSGRVCALSRGAPQMATAIDEDEVCVCDGVGRGSSRTG